MKARNTKRKVRPPLIFYFQPTEFEEVPMTKLAEWEKLTQKNLGFTIKISDGDARPNPHITKCPKKDDCGLVFAQQA